jgi:hypothetical protein
MIIAGPITKSEAILTRGAAPILESIDIFAVDEDGVMETVSLFLLAM